MNLQERLQILSMVRTFDGDNFDVVFTKVISELLHRPQYICSPRGKKIHELISPTILLRHPRARLLNLKSRDTKYGFGVGEFLWYWAGKNDLDTMVYYNKRMKDFSDDGKTVNSAYGYRIRTDSKYYGSTQWNACKKALLQDQDSRRAILIINNSFDNIRAVEEGSKDVPCTLSLQFFIRNNQLILHTNMRSNDAIWGLTYDLFSFTLLQEAMMLDLNASGLPGLQMGEYIHTAGSLHLYDQHFEMAEKIITEGTSSKFRPAAKMEQIDLKGLALLVEDEQLLREGKVTDVDLSKYSGGCSWMAGCLTDHRRQRNAK